MVKNMLKVKTKPEAIFGLLWRMFLPVNFRSFNALEDYGEDYDDDEVDDAEDQNLDLTDNHYDGWGQYNL